MPSSTTCLGGSPKKRSAATEFCCRKGEDGFRDNPHVALRRCEEVLTPQVISYVVDWEWNAGAFGYGFEQRHCLWFLHEAEVRYNPVETPLQFVEADVDHSDVSLTYMFPVA